MKKYIYLVFTFTVYHFAFSLQAQNAKIDSIKSELSTQKGDQLYASYLELMWEWRDIAPDSSIVFGEKLLSLTEKVSNFPDRAKVFNYLGVAYRNKGQYGLAFDNFKHALLQADINNNQLQKGYAYINIGTLFQFEGDHFEALKNLNEASKIDDA